LARTLILVDETGDTPRPTSDSATLANDGSVSYQGNGVRNIISKWLAENPADVVFKNAAGWSNGYATLQERE
jgi:hypothetical protein